MADGGWLMAADGRRSGRGVPRSPLCPPPPPGDQQWRPTPHQPRDGLHPPAVEQRQGGRRRLLRLDGQAAVVGRRAPCTPCTAVDTTRGLSEIARPPSRPSPRRVVSHPPSLTSCHPVRSSGGSPRRSRHAAVPSREPGLAPAYGQPRPQRDNARSVRGASPHASTLLVATRPFRTITETREIGNGTN